MNQNNLSTDEHDHNHHSHEYSHDHDDQLESSSSQDTKGYQRTLLFSFIIITGYMFIEAIGGWLTGSLALLSDAGHMLSDAVALGRDLDGIQNWRKSSHASKDIWL